jgi:3-deoxy-manno-octulosonate cytidylyltransferase (CMP-KDO synthetase)
MDKNKLKVVAYIPARMAATRFPGKPLADILGLPMIEHVRRRVCMSKLFADVVVATCDQEIFDAVVKFGGKALMTSDKHERCTDRIAEAAANSDADVVVNVQGDEPLVNPAMFEQLLAPLQKEQELHCTNLMVEILTDEEFKNPNVVKAVCDRRWNALYFSREPIPSALKAGKISYRKYKQLGIYAFRKELLLRFAQLPPTPHEQVESIDMLRIVEHGYQLRMVPTEFQSIGVDTPADLARVEELMKQDNLFKLYNVGEK